MKPRPDTPATSVPDTPRAAWGSVLHWSAFVLLLACTASRPFLNEMAYRTAAIPGAFGARPSAAPENDVVPESSDRMELARISFAVGIFLAVALWLAGAAANRPVPAPAIPPTSERRSGLGWLTALVLLFASLSLASALGASNKRSALDSWVEQVSLLTAAVLTARLCADRRRFVMVVVVLAAVGCALAARGYFEKWVQIPDRIAEFDKDRAATLARLGIADGSPQAAALANRVRDPAVTGFISLANVFASTLQVCLMAAAGLAAWKIAAAMKFLPTFRRNRKKGEIHLPSLAAVVAVLLAAIGAVVLIFTRSTGGIAAFVLALPVCWLVYKFRESLAKRWKTCLLAFGSLLLAGMAVVAAIGLGVDGRGNLGHLRKTLLFRWLYWEASAKIVHDYPALGVGPANFGTAYPQYRDVRGEEAVKNPHNFAMQALTEYGLPGGLCYLAVLGVMLARACRPGYAQPAPGLENRDSGATQKQSWKCALAAFLALTLAVLLARSYFAGAAVSLAMWVVDALAPAMALAAMLVAAWWGSHLAADHADSALLRVALGGGVAAFLLYEVISFNLTAPSAAAVFFLAVGAMMGRHGEPRPEGSGLGCLSSNLHGKTAPFRSRLAGWRINPLTGNAALAAGAFAVVIVIAATLWWPVYQRTRLTVEMQQAYSQQQWEPLAELATQAARADELDPLAAADAARAYGLLLPPNQTTSISHADQANLRAAYDWAKEAIRRDNQSGPWQQLAAIACSRFDPPLAMPHMERAVRLDPQDLRLRLQYAEMLACSSQPDAPAASLRELDAVEAIDRGLLPDSAQRLSPAERDQVRRLRQHAGTAATTASSHDP